MSIRSELLTLHRLPARLTPVEVAAVLGFQPHDIPVLVRHRLLKTLGNPAPQAPKYFASVEVKEKTRDAEWLNKATRTISNDWKKRNGKAAPLLLQAED